MTWSLTLSGLPREGTILKLRQYKQKLQKMKDLSKTWVLSWEHFEDLRRKKTENLLLTFQKNCCKVARLELRSKILICSSFM